MPIAGQSGHGAGMTAVGVKHAPSGAAAHDCIRLSEVAGPDDPLGDIPMARSGLATVPADDRSRLSTRILLAHLGVAASP
jgi:hypothetical protein